jgi:hypothetical protein
MLNFYPNSTSSARTKDSLNGDAVEEFLCEKQIPMLLEDGSMCPVPLQGRKEGLNATFDSHDATAPSSAEANALGSTAAPIRYQEA